jgi:hypothetical protein
MNGGKFSIIILYRKSVFPQSAHIWKKWCSKSMATRILAIIYNSAKGTDCTEKRMVWKNSHQVHYFRVSSQYTYPRILLS